VDEQSARSADPVIHLKSPREIEKMRAAGRIVAECHALAREIVKPGVRTIDVDEAVEKLIRSRGGEPAFLGYRGFPASTCISINEEVVHGIPGRRRIEEGDVVSFDVGVRLDGYFGDAAQTILVGKVSEEARRLKEATDKALELAISVVKPGEKLSTVARTVQTYAESNGYSVVRKFVGHGIGSQMHEDPQVPNFVSKGLLDQDVVLKPGMTIAIEPMLNVGTYEVRVKKNGWTVVTLDGKLSAHSEHTIAVTEEGHEILTTVAGGGNGS
jgi:methionyl aminopeptidase